MNTSNPHLVDRASSIYPPTISPPDSPYPSDVNSSNPDISPISANGPVPVWLRPSGIPQPRKQSPTDSPAPTPEPRQPQQPFPPPERAESAATASGTGDHSASLSPAGGWRDVVRSMRRSPSPNPSEAKSAAQSQSDGIPTRWDTISGEKTSDSKGKPGAASPNQHPYKGTDPGFGYTAHITGGTQNNGKPSHFLHVKLRKAGERKESPLPSQEPWRSPSGLIGPSGRSPIMDPVVERISSPPAEKTEKTEKKHFPTPAERRARGFFPRAGTGRTSPGPNAGLTMRSGTPTGKDSPPPHQPTEEKSSALRVMTGALDSMREAAAKAITQKDRNYTDPVVRPETARPETAIPAGEVVVSGTQVYKYRLGLSSPRAKSPVSPSPDYGPTPVASGRQQLMRRPSQDMLRGAYPEHAGMRSATMPVSGTYVTDSPMSYAAPTNTFTMPARKGVRAEPKSSRSADGVDFDRTGLANAFHGMGILNEPRSRFSATTYSTSVDGADSPPQTPSMVRPGVDSVPPLPTSTPPTGDSILNRKRPVPSASNQYRTKPQRKPTPMQSAAAAADGSVGGLEGSNGRVEPMKPVDRVTALEEKLNQLYRRKASLAAVIHELTNVVQPSSIAYDMASRAEIKKTVDGLRIEQAAVLKEIQEIGIKLHRAIKKRDEEEGGDGGGLWVRRVTE